MFRYALALMLLADVTISRAPKLDHQDYKLGVNVELVQLLVSVLDKKGMPIRGVEKCSTFTKTRLVKTSRYSNIISGSRSLNLFSGGLKMSA
jgi:hypothetical protein